MEDLRQELAQLEEQRAQTARVLEQTAERWDEDHRRLEEAQAQLAQAQAQLAACEAERDRLQWVLDCTRRYWEEDATYLIDKLNDQYRFCHEEHGVPRRFFAVRRGGPHGHHHYACPSDLEEYADCTAYSDTTVESPDVEPDPEELARWAAELETALLTAGDSEEEEPMEDESYEDYSSESESVADNVIDLTGTDDEMDLDQFVEIDSPLQGPPAGLDFGGYADLEEYYRQLSTVELLQDPFDLHTEWLQDRGLDA